MRVSCLVSIAALVLLSSSPVAQAQEMRLAQRDACVTQQVRQLQRQSAQRIVASGEVVCPQGDVVGFPPRQRRHDREGRITLPAGQGRVICPGLEPALENVSSNGGGAGPFEFGPQRSTVSARIWCNGAPVGQGRRWYRADLVAQSCPEINARMQADATRICRARQQ